MLEIRTVLLLMSIGSLLMAFILWSAFSGRMRDGLDKWALALGLQSVVWAAYAFDGEIPQLLSGALPDAVLTVSWMLKIAALLEFQQRDVPRRLLAGLAVLAIVPLAVLAAAGSADALALYRGWLFSAATLAIAWLAWLIPGTAGGKLRWLLVAIYAMVACGYQLRTYAVLGMPNAIPSPLASTSLQSGTFAVGYGCIILSSFCMLLLHKERADNLNYQLAITDPLTGVYNRRSFMEIADKLLAHSARTRSPNSLLMIDVDHFKRINDAHGHAVGDEALKGIVARVRHCLRDEDLLVRFGGEEFCVLMPGADAEGAFVLAERIRDRVAAEPIATAASAIAATVSIGVASADWSEARAKEVLFAAADGALYRAKGAGRNRTVLAAG